MSDPKTTTSIQDKPRPSVKGPAVTSQSKSVAKFSVSTTTPTTASSSKEQPAGSENTSQRPGKVPPIEPCSPTHNGREVTELGIMIERPQHLISMEDGTHQFTRIYYQAGKYIIHQGSDRLGVFRVLYAEYNRGLGLNILFSKGYRVHVPDHMLQVSYVLSDETNLF